LLPISGTIASNILTTITTLDLTTPLESPPLYILIEKDETAWVEVYVLLDDPVPFNIVPKQPSSCNGLCTSIKISYDTTAPNVDPISLSGVVTQSFDDINYIATLHVLDPSLVTTQYIIKV